MGRRFAILDAWRSLAIVLMVVYHFLYDLALFGVITWQQLFSPALDGLQKCICCSFIFLAGTCARFSRSNLRHGLTVLAAGVLVAIGAAVGGQTIRFGVLMLLGSSMVLYHLAGKALEKIPGWLLAVCSLALYVLTDRWTDSVTVTVPWLYPLGLTTAQFTSADYFPLLPWLFLFFIGTAFGGWCLHHRESPLLTRPLPACLTWPGRHSLIIYMLHQPVLYGISLLIWG